jgi:tetratricopeptide (TPR) repeat protein
VADGVLVQVELVDAHTGTQLWGHSYSQKQRDLPALQQDIAQEVAFRLRTNVDSSSKQRIHRQHTTVPAAQAAYAKGQSAMAEHTPASFDDAVNFFQQAIDVDPQYAPAYAELARCYALMAYNYDRPEAPLALMSKAESTARRALQLDSTLAEAYSSIAEVQLLRDYDWDEAEKNFRRAVQLDPGYIPAHSSYALHLLTARGRFAEARAQFTYADRIVPRTVGTDVSEALEAYFARRYEASVQQAEVTLNRFPGNEVVIEILAEDYVAMNKPAKALEWLAGTTPGSADAQISRDVMLGIAFAKQGQKRKAVAFLKRIERSKRVDFDLNYHLAALSTAVGDYDSAIDYLEKSYTSRQTSVLFIGVDPLMDALRSNARFQKMLVKMNLR